MTGNLRTRALAPERLKEVAPIPIRHIACMQRSSLEQLLYYLFI